MPLLSLTAEGEDAWLRFKQHVEWCDAFALIFLFSDYGAVAETFRSRLADIHRARIRGLLLDRPDSPEHLAERLIARLLRPGQAESSLNAPVWIDLASQRGQDWDKATREFLARLNERREPLRRVRTRPVILVLPQSDVATVAAMAPDLWAIRHYVLTLGSWASGAVAGDTASVKSIAHGVCEQVYDSEPVCHTTQTTAGTASVERAATPVEPFALNEAEERLVQEWERVADQVKPGSLRAGWRASAACRQRGRWRDMERIDRDVLVMARELVRLGETPESLRDVSVSLDNLGRTDEVLGQWESARSAYREGLEIRRGLVSRLGETPESLRDVSVFLDNVGRTDEVLGQWESARAAYAEGLAIGTALSRALPTLPDYQQLEAHFAAALARLRERSSAEPVL